MCPRVYMPAIYPQTVRLLDEAASESRPSSVPPGLDPVRATVAPGRTHLPGAHGAVRRPLGNVLPVLPRHLSPDRRGAGTGRRGDGSEERIDRTARLRRSISGDPGDNLPQEVGRRRRAGGDSRRAYDTRHLPEAAGPRNGRAGRERSLIRRARPNPILPDTQRGRHRPTWRTGVPLSESGGRVERADPARATRRPGGNRRKGGGRPRRGPAVVRHAAPPSRPAHLES